MNRIIKIKELRTKAEEIEDQMDRAYREGNTSLYNALSKRLEASLRYYRREVSLYNRNN